MNTLSPPLEIKHDHIDRSLLEAIRKTDAIANQCGAKYFLAGATAREVILRHVFGRPPGRPTLDVDFGIAVRDWNHFETLRTALVEEAGFEAHPRMASRRRHRYEGYRFQRWFGIGSVGSRRPRSGYSCRQYACAYCSQTVGMAGQKTREA